MSVSNIRIRFVERPLSERSLKLQAQAIIDDSSLRLLTISDTGIEMLTAMVGRGMTPALRRVVAESLRQTMQGNIPFGDQAADNILTEVYGEVIGPLMTCLERGGEFEIIRLERQNGADLLLVNKQSLKVILQECKGTFADYNKAKDSPSPLDVCQQMRDQRNKGKQQLQWPEADEIGSRRIRICGAGGRQACPIPHAEETVVVTAVPDGRLRKCAPQISPPAHEPCDKSCVKHCLFSPEPALVCVLSSRQVDDHTKLDDSTRNFLDWYKACERAIWGNAHGSVGSAFASTLSYARKMELSLDSQEASLSILVGLLEEAIVRNVYVDFGPIFEVSETMERPALSRAFRYLHDMQGDIQRPKVSEIEAQELGSMLYGTEKEGRGERLIGNWRFRTTGPRSEGEGTLAETSIQRTAGGNLEMRVVPSQAAMPYSLDDLRWGISNILSGGRFPPELVYELFTEETASWAPLENDIKRKKVVRTIVLGQVLAGAHPYAPLWFPFFDRRALRDMHSCCPECDMLADLIERHWPFPPDSFLWRHWGRHHRHHRWTLFGDQDQQPLAFVTNDARGFMSVPLVGV
jgi:hypothetical protein